MPVFAHLSVKGRQRESERDEGKKMTGETKRERGTGGGRGGVGLNER